MKYKWSLYWLAILYAIFAFLQMSALSVLVPNLKETFQIGETVIGALSATMLYTYAPLQFAVGYFLDRFGSKPCIIFGFIIIGIGTIIFAISPNIVWAYIGRALIGVGAAAGFITTTYIPPHYFPKPKVNFLLTLAIGLSLIGPIIAQTVLPYMINIWGWRVSIFILGGIPILLGLYSIFHFRKLEEEHSKNNPFLLLGRICKRYQTWLIILTIGCFYLLNSNFGYMWGVPYFESTGLSVQLAGVLTTTFFIGMIIAAPKIGHLSHGKFSLKTLILVTSILCAISFTIILFFDLPLWLTFVMVFLVGAFASGQNLLYILAFLEHEKEAKGMALSLTNFALIVISAVGQPLVGNWIEKIHKIKPVMWLFPVVLVITFILSLFLRHKPLHSEEEIES